MEKIAYEAMFAAEEGNWWFSGKRELILSFVDKLTRVRRRNGGKPCILDVGCGTGILLKSLAQYGDAQGVDISKEATSFCRKRGLKNVRLGSAMRLPFPHSSKDIVILADVLYHKTVDDSKALAEAYRVLRPGGHVIINDSAFPSLRSRHDTAVHGARRYTKKSLRTKMERAGFLVEKLSYFNTTLFPAVFAMRKADNIFNKGKSARVQRPDTGRVVNAALKALLMAEGKIIHHATLPFGVSIFAVARKGKDNINK